MNLLLRKTRLNEETIYKSEYQFESLDYEAKLVGINDQNLKLLEEKLDVILIPNGDKLTIKGDNERNVKLVGTIFHQLETLLSKKIILGKADVLSTIQMAQRGTLDYLQDLYLETLVRDYHGNSIHVKNYGQRQYVQSILHNDITFGIGPAGTGKTFLGVVMAIAALKKGAVEKIILTRPAVEAGESLGFLPGDLQEKVNPYLRPVYDVLHQILGVEHTNRLLERGVIEIAPLAYMRGRTLNSAFILLDEAQNTTNAQMKMFLTRLGFGSKMVVNGDITQIDLPNGKHSGLLQAQNLLKNVKHINFVNFGADDVVRNSVVQSIINAYEKQDR